MIQIGDNVRFLNSIGGGIVRQINKKGIAMVETDDGFEIPTPVKELVVVNDSNAQRNARPAPAVPAPQPPVVPKVSEAPPEETATGDIMNLFIAFLPLEANRIGGSYEAYFINDSNYYIYFNYMKRINNSYVTAAHALAEPNSRVFMEEFPASEVNDMERVAVQLVAFKKDKPFRLKNPASVELKIDPVKFYKIHCFVPNDYFDDDALLYPVVKADEPADRELCIVPAELQEAMQKKKLDEKVQPVRNKRRKTESPIVEVDLHIEQLLDTTAGMGSGEILEYQLDAFRRVLAQYAGVKGQKIIFIHGKGDGVLRASILKELSNKYKNYVSQDASFLEYGFGATLVTIR
ncbi:MAG: DUF2027 domain-containing protein [Tannerellaceae bacterium]|nr:DUF2027 domain-containing protein [Tannerellaceae bacterium]